MVQRGRTAPRQQQCKDRDICKSQPLAPDQVPEEGHRRDQDQTQERTWLH